MSFCAICSDDITPGQEKRAPIGRGDAMVTVCPECNDERPVERSLYRTYEAPNTKGAVGDMVRAGKRRVIGANATIERRHRPIMLPRTPGTVLVRVPVKKDGISRDKNEARVDLDGEPWANEARYIGLSRHLDCWYFLYERPDTEAFAEERRRDENPLTALEQFRVKEEP